MKKYRNRWTAVGLACLLAVSAGSAPFMEWTGMTVYAADAANGKCGEDLTWTLDDGTLTISGTGEMENYASESKVPWYSSRTSIKTVSIEEGVTSIGNYAFRACSSLSSITIPNNVTSIGVYAFRSCSNLSSITIPNNVTSIGYGAFYDCSKLGSITIPDSVTSIGNYAFRGCRNLSSITIPDSVTRIGNYAFAFCSNLSSITIPDSVTSIGNDAFRGCSNLSSIKIPNNVTSIGNYAFWGCSNLSSITIPNSVTSIGNYAFQGCSNLSSITIPDSVTSIGMYAFSGCSKLDSITIPNKVTSIGVFTFSGCSKLDSITIPNKVTSIGDYAFDGCSNLKSVIYHGTKTQWDKISNRFPSNLTVKWHTHIADSIWKSDQEHHWHQCTDSECPATDNYLQDDYAEHTWLGGKCTVCGYKRAHVHNLEPVKSVEATCTTAGNKTYYKCSGCDSLFASKLGSIPLSYAELTVPATGHKYDGYLQDAEGHWQQCSVCGEATAKESHDFSGNTCDTCGYQKPAEAETETNTETNTDSNANTSTYSSSHHDDDSTDVTDNSQKGRWVQDEKGWYFRRNDGSYPKSGWSKLYWLGKEYWYYFDENGYMKLGWMDVNGNRYYLNPVIGTNSGRMLTGWQLIDQKWYYFSTEQGAKEGSLLRNTVTPDHYPVDQDGVWKQ